MLGIMVASINYMLVVVTMCSIFVANFGMVDIFFRGGLLGILVASINYMLVVVTMCSIFVANFMVGEVFFF